MQKSSILSKYRKAAFHLSQTILLFRLSVFSLSGIEVSALLEKAEAAELIRC